VGTTADTAEVVRVSAVIEAVDAAAKSGAASVYVEILSKHGVRVPAPQREATDADTSHEDLDN
jgi:polyphosphate kinase 2 (PPK2 family)